MKSDQEVYDHYVAYCVLIGHTAPSFTRWMSLRDEPAQFDPNQSGQVSKSIEVNGD